MKKLIAFLIILSMLIAMGGCTQSSPESPKEENGDSSVEVPAPEETPEAPPEEEPAPPAPEGIEGEWYNVTDLSDQINQKLSTALKNEIDSYRNTWNLYEQKGMTEGEFPELTELPPIKDFTLTTTFRFQDGIFSSQAEFNWEAAESVWLSPLLDWFIRHEATYEPLYQAYSETPKSEAELIQFARLSIESILCEATGADLNDMEDPNLDGKFPYTLEDSTLTITKESGNHTVLQVRFENGALVLSDENSTFTFNRK